MSNKIAAIQISDSGLKVMVGEITNGVFRSWYHRKLEAFIFEDGRVDMNSLKIKLALAVGKVQKELKKVITSWYLVYDLNSVKITKVKDIKVGDYYIKRSSIKELDAIIKKKCIPNKNKELSIVLTKQAKYKWTGKDKKIHSQERIPEPGTFLQNLYIDALIYKAPTITIEHIKSMMEECELTIESGIPSCFCYPFTISSSVEKKHTFVVDIGNHSTKIMLYFKNLLLDYRTINIGSFAMTKEVSKKYKIGSLTKTLQIIKSDFTLRQNINSNVILHEHVVNEKKGKIISLTRENLKKEGEKFANFLHDLIQKEVVEIMESKNITIGVPIFITGGFTNAEGYQDFLEKGYRMQHLDVSSIEGLDNGFAALLGMNDLISEDLLHSSETINCISDHNYNFINRVSSKFTKNTVQKLLKL